MTDDAERAIRILGGDWAKCEADNCAHHARGIRHPNGQIFVHPGRWCQCCAKSMFQGLYDTDAYTCKGELIP